MTVSRADVTKIQDSERDDLLREFGISPGQRLAVGTEAQVYSYDEQHVLKVYSDPKALLPRLRVLKDFYDGLDEEPSGLKLPRIVDIQERGVIVGVFETRIPGVSLESLIPTLTAHELERAADLYLQGVFAISKLRIVNPPGKYLLFDQTDRSSVAGQTWSTFYTALLQEKVGRIGVLLNETVHKFGPRFESLLRAISDDTPHPLAVVHGDYFAGNVMVASDLSTVHGVVDFGSFTVFGDKLLDIGSAVGFFRMYEPNRRAIRHQMFDKVEKILTEEESTRMYRYLAGHAIITSDMYVSEKDPRDNGHFQWALDVLNDERIWSKGN